MFFFLLLFGPWCRRVVARHVNGTRRLSARGLPEDTESIDPRKTGETVAILIPIRSTNERRQKRLCSLLLSFEGWPRAQMQVAMLVSHDSIVLVREVSQSLRSAGLGAVRIIHEPELGSRDATTEGARHRFGAQRDRRAVIARARNYLASHALCHQKVDWVCWLDSDLLEVPSTLLVDLRKSDVSLVVPACYCSGRDACGRQIYDRNSWQDTPEAREEVRRLERSGRVDDDTIIVRGYGHYRHDGHVLAIQAAPLFLDDLKRNTPLETPLVPLDGVGATAIFLRASLHYQGLIFPPFAVNHAIESEGLAQIALKMGVQPYGRIDIAIKHA
ncbi:hypothetical protein CTAYLR_007539 [Chrysophaeum taylorii]|uniref:Uncharacterized protein n=1 Tax=Chrysophaeum taylorii TaxID=2483200 RepID=A0AAD7XGE3_9STRA|nr:hypothetical protein CTAYLR_007539 [Chrysophaeum taylorii]